MKKYNLGFIGCGNMAQAIINALTNDTNKYFLKKAGIKFAISVSDFSAAALDYAKQKQLLVLSNAELVGKNDLIILSVKPQIYKEATKDLNFDSKPVISIMAGVSTEMLQVLSPKIARVMPNLNARIGNSYNAYCTVGLSEDEEHAVECLLGSFGEVKKVKEEDMNKITGLSGSGPAFVFMVIEAFEQTALECGFDAATAREIALCTVIGSAYNVEAAPPDTKIGELVSSVCSKGGTTIEGVNYLNDNGLEGLISGAIKKAIARAGELEKLS